MRAFTAFLLAFGLILAFAVAPAAPVHAEELGIKFTTSNMQHRVKPEEIAELQRRIREVYPTCVDTVVAYIGDEDARKYLNTVTIAIQDNLANAHRNGESGYWSSGTAKDKQAVTLFAQMFLTGRRDLKTTLTHELLHVVMEYHNDFKALVGTPSYVKEGISYHGTNDVRTAMRTWLNDWDPELDFDERMKEKSTKRFLSERTFIECFGRVYGDAARVKFVRDFYNGKNWRAAIESASGEEKWTRARTKVRACRDEMVKEMLGQAGDYRAIRRDYIADNDERVIESAREYLAKDPNGLWAPSVAGMLAYSLEYGYRADEAIAVHEDLRTGKFGSNKMDDNAAFHIVRLMGTISRCDEARAKRAEFERFYPNFYLQKWRKDLDDEIAKSCRDSAIQLYEAKKLAHAKSYAEARAAAEDAIAKRLVEDGAEKSAGWNRDVRATVAGWHSDDGKNDDAAKAYEAVIAEFREKAPNERRDLADVLVEAAEVDEKLGRFPAAEAKLSEALTLYRAALGPFDKTIPITEGKLGLIYVKMGEADKARERLTKALEDMIASSKTKSAPRAKAHLDLAGFLKDQGDAAGALANAKTAHEIYAEIYPADQEDAVRAAELVKALSPQ